MQKFSVRAGPVLPDSPMLLQDPQGPWEKEGGPEEPGLTGPYERLGRCREICPVEVQCWQWRNLQRASGVVRWPRPPGQWSGRGSKGKESCPGAAASATAEVAHRGGQTEAGLLLDPA